MPTRPAHRQSEVRQRGLELGGLRGHEQGVDHRDAVGGEDHPGVGAVVRGRRLQPDVQIGTELDEGKEVMDEFHEREPSHQEWKRGVLAGEIELEEIDTEPCAVGRRRA